MISTIKPWGNSQGLYIPKEFLKRLGLNVHDRIEMTIEDNRIIIRKDDSLTEKAQALETLKELRKQLKPLPSDFDWKEELSQALDERFGNV